MPLDSKSTPSRGRVAKWRRFVSVAALLLGAGSAAFAEGRAPRILILYPDSNLNRAASMVGETIQKRLSEQATLDIQMHGEFLDLARFPDAAHKQRVVQYLSEKYAASPPDLVLALGPDALRIAIDNRNALAAGAPITFCCISPNRLATIDKPDDVTGIISDFDVAKTVQLAQALQPNARQLVIVSGAAPFDVRSVETARQQLARLPSQLDTRYIVGLPRNELLRHLAKLDAEPALRSSYAVLYHAIERIGVPTTIAKIADDAQRCVALAPAFLQPLMEELVAAFVERLADQEERLADALYRSNVHLRTGSGRF